MYAGTHVFPGGSSGKQPACQCRRYERHRFNPWVGKIPWKKKWQPTPVFLPGKCHGQRYLVDSCPWGHKELDTTERQCNAKMLTWLSVQFSSVAQSCPTLATPWTVAHQAPLFMGFPREEHWSGLPFLLPGDLPNPGIEPASPAFGRQILYH